MKSALILFATIAAVQCGITRTGRQGWPMPTTTQAPGWPAPTTTKAPGWPAPTTTQAPGWPTPTTTQAPGWPAPTQAPGWPAPAAQGWGAPPALLSPGFNINISAALAAAGSGWAGENHNDAAQVTGSGGWGGPGAQLVISSNGGSLVGQEGAILEVTSQDLQGAAVLQTVNNEQAVVADENQNIDASGLEIINAQNGWAAASGEGASSVQADGDPCAYTPNSSACTKKQ